MKYDITIEETITQAFTIEGESVQDAMKNASKQYKDGVLTVDNGELQEAKVLFFTNDGQVLEEGVY